MNEIHPTNLTDIQWNAMIQLAMIKIMLNRIYK